MSIKLIDERKQKIKNGIKLKSKQKVVFYRFQSDYIFSNECVYMMHIPETSQISPETDKVNKSGVFIKKCLFIYVKTYATESQSRESLKDISGLGN